MTKITVGTDCGNAPKRIFLRDFNIAFATGDIDFIADSVSDDIQWDMVGETLIEGKADFVTAVEQMKAQFPKELIIHHVVTHGREGTLDGEIIMADGKTYAFCDMYEFVGAKGAKIKSITSFVIERPAS